MNDIFEKSFKGLTREFYLSHFFIGFLVGFVFVFTNTKGFGEFYFFVIFFGILNTFLYPYSRYGLETAMNKLFGSDGSDSNLLFDVKFIILEKFVAIIISWFLAIFISPFALMQIYKLNNKAS